MKDVVQIAVIGCGGISNYAHLPNYAKNKNCKIKYVVDVKEDRAIAAMEKYGAEGYFTDYKELIKKGDFDAVSLCVPNYWHDVMAIDFLRAGKDVLSEKPVANDYKRALEMQKVAHETGRILNVDVCLRYSTAVNKVKEIIDNGTLGNLYNIFCSFRAFRNIPGLGGPFTDKKLSGGGVVIDWGVHRLDLILYAAGITEIKSVTADCYNEIGREPKSYLCKKMWGDADIENGTKTVEEFSTGFVRTNKASITFVGAWAQNIAHDEQYIDFMGDKGGIRYRYCDSFELFHTINNTLYTSTPFYEEGNFYEGAINDFIYCVQNDCKTSRSNIDNVMPSAKLLQAIYDSADLKKEIKF